jgi:ribulose-phosphate 3-epimerase
LNIYIVVDGRVSFDNIPGLVAAGATDLVAGSSSPFHSDGTLAENIAKMKQAISLGIAMRNQP